MSAFPATRKALEEAGYRRKCYTRCKACKAAMEFWHTPEDALIPMEHMPDEDSPAVSHFARCPDAKTFRKAGKR